MNNRARLAAAGAGLATTGMLGLVLAPAAFAGPGGGVTAVTHAPDHADTTSNAGPCTVDSPNGPVWAYDNLSLRFTVAPETSPGDYSVTITAHGSFHAFADPTTGACYSGSGSVDGWIQYDVTSSTPPDPGNLPAQEQPSTGQWDMLEALFHGNAAYAGGGHYNYSYNRVDGARYTQTG